MNECIKTGFKFLELETGLVRTGDLFYFSGFFQIRGIPKGTYPITKPYDAVVANVILAQRADSEYQDSNIGVSIIAPSQEFVEHVHKWYPDLKEVIVNDQT